MLGRRLWPALTAVALCLVMVSPTHATKLAGEFLSTGFGAKALGMGGAFASIADDASAIYWNPAGLVQMDRSQVLLMHSERFGNLVDYNCFSVVRPISEDPDKRTNGGLGLIWLRVSDIKITSHLARPDTDFVDSNANGRWDPGERRLWSPDNVRNESDNEIAGYLSYSFRIKPNFSLGVNAKLIWKEIADISALGFGLDAGVLYNLTRDWQIGVNLQDVTSTPLYWDGWYFAPNDSGEVVQYKVSTKETIYPTLKVGTSYALPVTSLAGRIVLAADCDFKFEGLRGEEVDFWAGDISADVRLGVMYEYREMLRVSFGMDRQEPSAGIGLTAGPFGLDYAFWRDSEIDNTHRLSVSMDF